MKFTVFSSNSALRGWDLGPSLLEELAYDVPKSEVADVAANKSEGVRNGKAHPPRKPRTYPQLKF